VLTGRWSSAAEKALASGEADGLVLNYARGFSEPDLQFLASWGIRRLQVLDRKLTDLEPIARLSESLESLSVQAAPQAELDLGALPRVRAVAGEWPLLRDTLGRLDALESVITWRFDEIDLHAFRDHVCLKRLTIKEAPHLESLSGIADLPELAVLGIIGGPALHDITEVADPGRSLRELELQDCSSIIDLDCVEELAELRFLGFSNCGAIASLAPLRSLHELEVLHAWGSTRVVDGDLSPLPQLPRLREVRMRDRANYTPLLSTLVDENAIVR
jgi:hypothetical protein